MLHYERMVRDRDLITGILDMCDTVYVGLNDDDGVPYVVPMNFGYLVTEEALLIIVHSHHEGHKIDLWQRDPRVGVTFSRFHNLASHPYKGHLHDFRSVQAKGVIRMIDRKIEAGLHGRGLQAMLRHNNRGKTQFAPNRIPLMDMYVITCPWDKVTGKAEWPVRTAADLPFADPEHLPQDDTPFDVRDLMEKNADLK